MDRQKLYESQKLNKFLFQMKKDNKKLDDVLEDYEYMGKYLNKEDIIVFRNYVMELKNTHFPNVQKYIEENYVPENKCK